MNFPHRYIIAFILTLLNISLHAQKSITIHQIREPLVIDGIHEAAAWIGMEPAADFIQMEPDAGDPATLESEFFIGQDNENIYVSAILYQETKVTASIQNRDHLSTSDDCIILLIDSYNDKRSGYGSKDAVSIP